MRTNANTLRENVQNVTVEDVIGAVGKVLRGKRKREEEEDATERDMEPGSSKGEKRPRRTPEP
jgi:ribosomal protein L19E